MADYNQPARKAPGQSGQFFTQLAELRSLVSSLSSQKASREQQSKDAYGRMETAWRGIEANRSFESEDDPVLTDYVNSYNIYKSQWQSFENLAAEADYKIKLENDRIGTAMKGREDERAKEEELFKEYKLYQDQQRRLRMATNDRSFNALQAVQAVTSASKVQSTAAPTSHISYRK